jgi:uncharacterized protein (DUF433 family)
MHVESESTEHKARSSFAMSIILGHGVYSLPEAARLTRLRSSRVREWFTGRSTKQGLKPVFKSDYDSVGGDRAISFLDLIELFIAGQLREHGVSLQSLRKVREQLQKDLETRHPFCRREVLSDGKKVFTFGLDPEGKREMIEVLSKQRVFVQILLPFLKRIDYDDATKLASKWSIADRIVVDPTICLGKPIVEEVCIRTTILASAFGANHEDLELVAEWFGVLPLHVQAAVDFERSLVA